MKQTILSLSLLAVSVILYPRAGHSADGASAFARPDTFQIRSETHLGCRTAGFRYETGDLGNCIEQGDPYLKLMLDQCVRLEGNSKGFIDIPRMASKFVAVADDTVAVISFSAWVMNHSVEDEPLLVRALVDGQEASPGQIVFTSGFDQAYFGTSSFTFTTKVTAGIHTVQMQWSTESSAARAYIRNGSIHISVDSKEKGGHRVVVAYMKDHSPPLNTDGASWTPIPHAELSFNLPDKGTAAITFAGVVKLNKGEFVQIRAVLDDGATLGVPAEGTLVHRAFHLTARSLTFTTGQLTAGNHKVQFQWRPSKTDITAKASLHTWTVSAVTARRETDNSMFDVKTVYSAKPTSLDFQPVPGFETEVLVNETSDIVVTLSASYSGLGQIIATVMSDDTAIPYSETSVYVSSSKFDDKGHQISYDMGGQSYTFALKDVPARSMPYRIGIAYRVLGSDINGSNPATLYNATMTVISKRRIGPDLAVGANMGAASSILTMPIARIRSSLIHRTFTIVLRISICLARNAS